MIRGEHYWIQVEVVFQATKSTSKSCVCLSTATRFREISSTILNEIFSSAQIQPKIRDFQEICVPSDL